MLFANKIRQLREERKLPQRHLAAALGMDAPIFSKIKRGKRSAPFNSNEEHLEHLFALYEKMTKKA